MEILMKWTGFIAALITIIGTLLSSYITGWPISSFLSIWQHRLTRIHSSKKFQIEAIRTKWGRVINPQDKFSYKFQIPLDARGSTTLRDSDYVWVVLKDQTGGYYLQNPPTEIRSGEWIAYNIRPLEGIKKILWLQVDDKGNQILNRKVQNAEWGKFTKLPDSSAELAYVELS